MIKTVDPSALKRVTEGMVALPTLPLAASRLIDAIARPDTSSEEVARILSLDPSLTARTLRLANSDFYGFPREVGAPRRSRGSDRLPSPTGGRDPQPEARGAGPRSQLPYRPGRALLAQGRRVATPLSFDVGAG